MVLINIYPAIFKRIASSKTAQYVKKIATARAPPNVISNVFPLVPVAAGAVAGAAMAGRNAGKIATFARSAFQRVTANPLAGTTLKQFAAKVGGRALGIGLSVEAFQYQRSRASGQPFHWLPNLGSVIAFAVNPLAAIGGTLFGSGEKIAEKIADRGIPQIPQPPTFNFPEQPDINIDFPDYPSGTMSDFPALGGFVSPVFSVGAPSANIDTGTNFAAIAAAMGIPLAVLLAYLGIKSAKKKKRKKYKGRKRKK